MDRSQWAGRAQRIAAIFRTRTRNTWVTTFASLDACVTPVLTAAEAVEHPANVARNVFTSGTAPQPQPAPRFSRTPSDIAGAPQLPGEGGRAALLRLGFTAAAIAALTAVGVVRVD